MADGNCNVKGVVYLARNIRNGKGYVGQTAKTIKWRKMTHLGSVRDGSSYCFHKAIRKYGADSFVWSVLHESQDYDELSHMERHFIIALKTKVPHGYNLTDGGEGTRGFSPSAETRATWSKNRKGRKHSASARAKVSAALRERWRNYSEDKKAEIRAKIGASNKGRVVSEETVLKLRMSHLGKTMSAESRAKVSAASTGRKPSDKDRAKMSFAARNRSPEHRAKLSELMRLRQATKRSRKRSATKPLFDSD